MLNQVKKNMNNYHLQIGGDATNPEGFSPGDPAT